MDDAAIIKLLNKAMSTDSVDEAVSALTIARKKGKGNWVFNDSMLNSYSDKNDTLSNELQEAYNKINELNGQVNSLKTKMSDMRMTSTIGGMTNNVERLANIKLSRYNDELKEHITYVEDKLRDKTITTGKIGLSILLLLGYNVYTFFT